MRFHHNIAIKHTRERQRQSSRHHGRRIRLTVLGATVVFTVAGFIAMANLQGATAYARDFNAEIQALQNQINDYNKRASELSDQADTLQSKIDELQNRQNQIQAQIDLNEAKRQQLEQEIADAEARIKKQAEALSKNLQSQYYSSQTSALDILMNSDSVSDYVDRQTRQQAMSDQITNTVNEIKQAKAQLESDKAEVESIIKQQDAQKQDLASAQAEQQQLLEQTQGQEAKYQELTAATQAKMEQVKAELEAANAAMRDNGGVSGGIPAPGASGSNGAACGGGYPTKWCTAAQDSLVDSWGMYNRECVSYAAYRVASTYGYMPYWGGHGMAYQWKQNAINAGYKVTRTPEPGTVAWRGKSSSTPVGHVGFVESVDYNNRTYVVSEYNSDGYGHYFKMQYSFGQGFTDFLWIGK